MRLLPAEPPTVEDALAADLTDPALYADGDPHAVWALLRRHAPVHWCRVDADRGFWAVTRHEECARVLRDHAAFTSQRGNLLYTLGGDDPASGRMMPSTDPPAHAALREPAAAALSRRAMSARSEAVRSEVRRWFAPLADGGVHDLAPTAFVLPMAVVGPLLGIERADWERIVGLTLAAVAPEDPAFALGDREQTLAAAHMELFEYLYDLVLDRAGRADDLVDGLAGDGASPVEDVVYNCFSLLLGATVTTPGVVTGMLTALLERPDLHARLAAEPDLVPSAVEECLRWSTPTLHFLRHATEDVELGGVRVRAGDAVTAWVPSANRDEQVFAEPDALVPDRPAGRHLGFGVGRHYCVGAPLARLSLSAVLAELVGLVGEWEVAGPVRHLRSHALGGLASLPVRARLGPSGQRRLDEGGADG